MALAQQIDQRFGKQLTQNLLSKNLTPELARGSLSGAAASTAVGPVGLVGFVAKDYLTDQITANEALIQSGIGLGSVAMGAGASLAATWAIGGSAAGPVGMAAGLVLGTVFYLGGNWYYENFKLESIRAEMALSKETASKWEAEKMEGEIPCHRSQSQVVRQF